MQRLLGHWAWWATLDRRLFSAFESSYSFLFSDSRAVPLAVREELRSAADLAPLLLRRLDRPYHSQVAMVDAGPEFGAVVVARAPPAFGGQSLGESMQPGDVPAWRVATVHRWKRSEHNNIGEARTVVMAASRFARCSAARGKRWLVWSDSTVAIGAFAKGRSSSRPLNRQCRRLAAILWAHDAEVVLRHVPSGLNMADGPSRGLPWAGVAPDTLAKSRAAERGARSPGPPAPPGL